MEFRANPRDFPCLWPSVLPERRTPRTGSSQRAVAQVELGEKNSLPRVDVLARVTCTSTLLILWTLFRKVGTGGVRAHLFSSALPSLSFLRGRLTSELHSNWSAARLWPGVASSGPARSGCSSWGLNLNWPHPHRPYSLSRNTSDSGPLCLTQRKPPHAGKYHIPIRNTPGMLQECRR